MQQASTVNIIPPFLIIVKQQKSNLFKVAFLHTITHLIYIILLFLIIVKRGKSSLKRLLFIWLYLHGYSNYTIDSPTLSMGFTLFFSYYRPTVIGWAGFPIKYIYSEKGEDMWRIVATILCIFAIWLVFWLEGDDKW